MREPTQPVADRFAASHDPAAVKVWCDALDKVHATVR